jgi:hypothetical protein
MADADYDPEAAAGTLLPFQQALPTPAPLSLDTYTHNVIGHG